MAGTAVFPGDAQAGLVDRQRRKQYWRFEARGLDCTGRFNHEFVILGRFQGRPLDLLASLRLLDLDPSSASRRQDAKLALHRQQSILSTELFEGVARRLWELSSELTGVSYLSS